LGKKIYEENGGFERSRRFCLPSLRRIIGQHDPLEMSQKTFNTLAGVVFVVVAVLHLSRLLFQWEAVIGGWAVPTWVSALALVLSGYFALSAFKLRK